MNIKQTYICSEYNYFKIANIKFRVNNRAKTINNNIYSIYLRNKYKREVDFKKANNVVQESSKILKKLLKTTLLKWLDTK